MAAQAGIDVPQIRLVENRNGPGWLALKRITNQHDLRPTTEDVN